MSALLNKNSKGFRKMAASKIHGSHLTDMLHFGVPNMYTPHTMVTGIHTWKTVYTPVTTSL